MNLKLKRSMTVILVNRAPIDLWGDVLGYVPKVEVGERGVIIKDEGGDGLAECRFADCTLLVNRSMVELG